MLCHIPQFLGRWRRLGWGLYIYKIRRAMCDTPLSSSLFRSAIKRIAVTVVTVAVDGSCRSAFSLPSQRLQSPIKCDTQSFGPSFVAPRLISPFVLAYGKTSALHTVFALAITQT